MGALHIGEWMVGIRTTLRRPFRILWRKHVHWNGGPDPIRRCTEIMIGPLVAMRLER